MKVLVDTHALVWALNDPDLLSADSQKVLREAEVVVSVASLWELILKSRRNSTLLSDPIPWWQKFVVDSGLALLSIRNNHVLTLGLLPEVHKDPFDRILVAQSMAEQMPLVTKDALLSRYPVKTIW